MTFRVSAVVAGLAVFGLAELSPVLAQPQAPVRPRYSSFGSIFSPSRGPQGQQLIGNAQMQPFMNPLGPQVLGGAINPGGGFILSGSGALPQALPGVYTIDPLARPTGVVGTFNNLGHWYGSPTTGGGYYGHWYPGGVTNGRGILGYGGGNLGGGAVVLPTAGGVGPRAGGSLMGTAFTAGATVNQFRR